jgi:flagellar basal-body rod protein FlgC
MSLFNVFDITATGMSAQSVRINTTASNIANADSVSSSVDKTYRARHPVFAAELQKAAGNQGEAVGVQVLGIVESNKPLNVEYAPDHPMADANGYIYKPNVNVVEEMTNMISASRSYQTNVQLAESAKSMVNRTLTLGQR